jgi:GTP-binding protein
MHITSATFIRGIIGTDDIIHDGIPHIAFVGRSNVGKSSVINALVGQKDLVKVGKKPGKTTEINFFLINRKYYFVDLPGYGYAQLTPVEREKIRKRMLWYLMESGAHPLHVALVVDIRAGFTEFDLDMAQLLRDLHHPFLVIANKTDKLSQKEISEQMALIRDASLNAEVLLFSAEKHEGVAAVLQKLLTA